jgi:hypothetical protein
MMQTTLYEKLFIDGFQKPSYVVVTVLLERTPDAQAVEWAARQTLALHPRLRSVVRTRFGVPFELVPSTWRGVRVHDGTVDLRALEERLLSTALDLQHEPPLEVHLVRDPPALVLKIHHAVIDASSGFAVLRDFAHALEGREIGGRAVRPSSRVQRARDWLTHVQLRPRLPDAGVVASFRPTTALADTPVTYCERLLPRAHARIARSARTRGATFSELVASSMMSAMARYNEARNAQPPASVGLMFARARPRRASRASSDAAFRADTCIVSAPRKQLARPHHPETLAELRRRANEQRHNDVALAALYARRKLLGRPPSPAEETAISFTLSDLTTFGRGLARTSANGALAMNDIRVLASPTSFDHAGMLLTRFGDDLRFAIVSHRGALDADALLDLALENLEER